MRRYTKEVLSNEIIKLSNNKYKLKDCANYKNEESKIIIIHNNCGNEIEITWKNLKHKFKNNFNICPYCKIEQTKNKNIKLKNKVSLLSNNEYELINGETYKDINSEIQIKHKKCDTIINLKWKDFYLKAKYNKSICPKCKRTKEKQEKLNKKIKELSNDKFEITSLFEYQKANSKLEFKHKQCGSTRINSWQYFSTKLKTTYDIDKLCPYCYSTKKNKYSLDEISKIIELKTQNQFRLVRNQEKYNYKNKLTIKCNYCNLEKQEFWHILNYKLLNDEKIVCNCNRKTKKRV